MRGKQELRLFVRGTCAALNGGSPFNQNDVPRWPMQHMEISAQASRGQIAAVDRAEADGVVEGIGRGAAVVEIALDDRVLALLGGDDEFAVGRLLERLANRVDAKYPASGGDQTGD